MLIFDSMLYICGMTEKERKIQRRCKWLKIYAETGSVTKTALRCGIARSTLYRWIKRHKEYGEKGLSDKSQRPQRLANMKVTPKIESLILELRETRRWGSQRISNHLLRNKTSISAMTVWRVLRRHEVKPVVRRRRKSDYIRYNKEVPGERVQMDVTKLRTRAYQFTAIDDCTRLKVIRVYPNKKASSTILFLHEMIADFPFPIQRVQTDWGTEFFNYDFQCELHEHFIKFRPIKPRTPHLNGKVERTQQTDKTEFWNIIDLSDKSLDLNSMALEWQDFYNLKRHHSSLGGMTPWQKFKSVESLVPIQPVVSEAFYESEEEIIPHNYEYLNFCKRKNESKLKKRK